MARPQMPRAYNLGNALVIAGVLALGATFWLPHATAARMLRVEQRAETCARRLCELAKDIPDLDFHAPAAHENILQRLEGDRLEPQPAPAELSGKALVFRSKHYYYMLTRTPPERGDGDRRDNAGSPSAAAPQQHPAPESAWRWPWRFADPSRLLPFEVYAWPASLVGPGVAVFFHPSDGPPAFCRNLDHTYHGLDKHPLPGQARQQFDGRERSGLLKWYRGFDNARWLIPGSDLDDQKNSNK
jgi:hypothetical protein